VHMARMLKLGLLIVAWSAEVLGVLAVCGPLQGLSGPSWAVWLALPAGLAMAMAAVFRSDGLFFEGWGILVGWMVWLCLTSVCLLTRRWRVYFLAWVVLCLFFLLNVFGIYALAHAHLFG